MSFLFLIVAKRLIGLVRQGMGNNVLQGVNVGTRGFNIDLCNNVVVRQRLLLP